MLKFATLLALLFGFAPEPTLTSDQRVVPTQYGAWCIRVTGTPNTTIHIMVRGPGVASSRIVTTLDGAGVGYANYYVPASARGWLTAQPDKYPQNSIDVAVLQVP